MNDLTPQQKAARMEALHEDLDHIEEHVRSMLPSLAYGFTSKAKRQLVNLLEELAEEAKAI